MQHRHCSPSLQYWNSGCQHVPNSWKLTAREFWNDLMNILWSLDLGSNNPVGSCTVYCVDYSIDNNRFLLLIVVATGRTGRLLLIDIG